MGISLYTSREVLAILGETDFGIYNIVGGVVVLFTFINSSMTGSTQRFVTHALGRKDDEQACIVFNESIKLHLIICGIIFLLGETIGLWFTYYKLNIPADSRTAALIVYQISLVNCCVSVIKSPFNACVVAYERMSFYGYTSVIEGAFKLGLVFVLLAIAKDRLIIYAWFMLGASVVLLVWYYLYCQRNFPIVRYKKGHDKETLKGLISFSGWSLFGSASVLGINQGVSIIMNIFFGVVVNAAIGLANQVYSAVYAFVSNFQTAFIPQIMKSYAGEDRQRFIDLMLRSSRFSFLLLAVVGIPIFFYAETILGWWLVEVPPSTAAFIKVIILSGMFDAISGPLWVSVQAAGKIRNYQIVVSLIYFLALPLCYFMIKLGANEWEAFSAKLIINGIAYIFRLIYNIKNFALPWHLYLLDVLGKCLFAGCGASMVSFLMSASVRIEVVGLAVSFIGSALSIVYLGLRSGERKKIFNSISQKLHLSCIAI